MGANRVLNLTGLGELRLGDGATRTTTLKSAAALASNLSFSLPAADGAPGFVLSTNGSGVLSFVPAVGGTDFATVRILGQGPLELQDAAGGEFVRLRAPATVAASYTLTLPDALPGATSFIQVDNTGVVSFASGSSTLQTAYDAGPTITLDATGDIVITQPLNDVALTISKTGLAAGTALVITDDGTGGCVSLGQTGNAVALTVTKAAGAANVVNIAATGAISGALLSLTAPDAGSSIALDLTSEGTGIGARIVKSTQAAIGLQLTQNTDAIGLDINKVGAGAGNAVDIDNDGTGFGIHIEQDGAGTALNVDQDGNATGIILNQAANQIGLDINKTGAGAGAAVDIDNDGTGSGLNIQQDGAGNALVVTQNGNAVAAGITQTQNQKALRIFKSGAGAGTALEIENDGSGIGLHVLQDGDAVACQIAAASASAEAVLQLTHGSSDPFPDVSGTSGLWTINNRGTAALARVSQKEASHTISGGAITITSSLPGGSLIVDTEAAAASDNLDNILSDSSDPVIAGTIIAIRAANSARTINVRSNAPGNLRLNAGGDRPLDNADDTLLLWYNGTNWLELAFSSNGG